MSAPRVRGLSGLPMAAMIAAIAGLGAATAAPPATGPGQLSREIVAAMPAEKQRKRDKRQRMSGGKKPREDAKRLSADLREWYRQRSDNGRRRFRAAMWNLGAHTDGEWYWPRLIVRGSQAMHRSRAAGAPR